MKANLDAIDRKILKFLIQNARMPYLEIARECGISGAAIHQRIHKLTESGIIRGSYMEVNPKALGFGVCAHILITLKDPKLMEKTVEELERIPEIVEAHFISGKGSIQVKLYCQDNEHLMHTVYDKVLRLQGIATTETTISLREVFRRPINLDFLAE